MAKKRPEFSFPELDQRGRNAILRSSAEVAAEEALLAEAARTSPAVPPPAVPPVAEQSEPDLSGKADPSNASAVRQPRTTRRAARGPVTSPEDAAPSAVPSPDQDAAPVLTLDAPVRARTHARQGTQHEARSSAVIDRLRQKLRTKQHLSSYTFRFRPEELEQLDQLVAELNRARSTKLSKNDLVRVALGWLLTDYETYGSESLVVEVTRQE